MALTAEQRAGWDDDGFFILRGFADQATLDAMIKRVNDLARSLAGGLERDDLIPIQESILVGAADPADSLSKLFRIMRTEDVFREFATRPDLLALVAELIGPDIDCFLSQFIFKHPGALGQPWHQDNFYFRLEPVPQVGVWLACTAATPDNGPLWVAPGSHREPIHDVVDDQREHANYGYVEIVDADVSGARMVLMDPGDLLIFHSHLRHMSTDNQSDVRRAAMVYHYADSASVGARIFNHDWTAVRRDGAPTKIDTTPVAVSFG